MTPSRLLVPFLVLAGSCATAHHGTRPGDMTAAEHLDNARSHTEQISGWRGTYRGVYGGHHAGYWGPGSGWYPWYYSWDPDEEHRALAAAHRDAADQLKLQFEAACAYFPRGLEVESPLDSFTTSISAIPSGVVFHVSDRAGSPDAVLASLRCHRAWLQLAPNPAAANNPLLIEGVKWMTHAGRDDVEVMATARDDGAAAELARRSALTLERARRSSSQRPGESADARSREGEPPSAPPRR